MVIHKCFPPSRTSKNIFWFDQVLIAIINILIFSLPRLFSPKGKRKILIQWAIWNLHLNSFKIILFLVFLDWIAHQRLDAVPFEKHTLLTFSYHANSAVHKGDNFPGQGFLTHYTLCFTDHTFNISPVQYRISVWNQGKYCIFTLLLCFSWGLSSY